MKKIPVVHFHHHLVKNFQIFHFFMPCFWAVLTLAVMLLLQEFLSDARAYWVTKSLIAWDVSDQETSLYLYASRSATMCMSNGVVEGG